MNPLRLTIQILLVALIIGGAWLGFKYLLGSAKEPPKRPQHKSVRHVEATRLKKVDYPVLIKTFGTLRPRTQSTLIPEVSGQVIKISESLREGGFFETGEVLLEIDKVDYDAAVVIADGELAQAKALLSQEKARAEQAAEDWKRLDRAEEPTDLVLRKPQLADVRSKLASAEARIRQARKDLERTKLVAPYAGQVLEKNVDVGQYVSPGNVLARIFAIDYAEIRLRVTNEQLGFLDIPERYRGDTDIDAPNGPSVKLYTTFAGRDVSWEGKVVRSQSAVDTMSFEHVAVARVKDPYAKREEGHPPLKVGTFLNAEIAGKVLTDVFVFPSSAVIEGREVLVVGKEQTLEIRKIRILWKEADKERQDLVVVDEGLEEGEILCLTPLGFGAVGSQVLPTIDGEKPPEAPGAKRRGPPKKSP